MRTCPSLLPSLSPSLRACLSLSLPLNRFGGSSVKSFTPILINDNAHSLPAPDLLSFLRKQPERRPSARSSSSKFSLSLSFTCCKHSLDQNTTEPLTGSFTSSCLLLHLSPLLAHLAPGLGAGASTIPPSCGRARAVEGKVGRAHVRGLTNASRAQPA